MAVRDFDLRILKAGSHYLADVRSPDGEEANRAFELPIPPERLDELFRGLGHPRKATRGGGSPEVRQARDFGRQLFEAVFAGDIRDVFQRSLGRVEARGGDLRIRLRLARDVPELLDLPWELWFDRGRNRFLALEPSTTLVRHLPVQQRIEPMRVAPPLRILVAISNPGQAGCPALDVEQEWANLDQALRPLVNRGRVSLTRLDGVTQESLRQALKREACHVLHYIGHGGYDSTAETGLLVLEDNDGGARSCGASRLTFLLREQPALRLVVLNACEGGRSSRTDPFAGVAQSLVQGAIPAVVAMQFPVTDAAAVVFASAFYEALASGRPVDLALAEARREVNLRGEEGEIEWATPVLYMRGDGDLFSFEDREPVQPEPTNVAPRTATPPPGTGAAPTAEHDRTPEAEPVKTPTEKAKKKPSTWWIIVSPFIVAVGLWLILIKTPRQLQETTTAAAPVADTKVARPASTPAPVAVPTAPEGERKVLVNGPKPLHAGYKTGDMFQECDQCPEMVAVVPDGPFTIGSPENEGGLEPDEKQFGLDFDRPYALGRYEVTRTQFAQSGVKPKAGCYTWTASKWEESSASWEKPGFDQTGKHPAVCVIWDDAVQYVKWLNGLGGNTGDRNYRLPSEAEWEYAARGGNYPAEQFPRFWGKVSDEACAYANVADESAKEKFADWKIDACRDGYVYTAPVGSFKANPFGLSDMLGNVREWVQDCYAEQYNLSIRHGRAYEPMHCTSRVLRGGSWASSPWMCGPPSAAAACPGAGATTTGSGSPGSCPERAAFPLYLLLLSRLYIYLTQGCDMLCSWLLGYRNQLTALLLRRQSCTRLPS